MSGSKAGIRYAKAVIQQAQETNTVSAMFEDMQSVGATLENSKELRNVLQSPVIKSEDKKEALLAIFSNQSEGTHTLIKVLVENQRTSLLGDVANSFINLYNEERGVKVARVTTAVTLTDDLESKVLDKVKELTGSTNVSLESTIDPSIIGGFVLRVGDLQYNASIANQLGNLKENLVKVYNLNNLELR